MKVTVMGESNVNGSNNKVNEQGDWSVPGVNGNDDYLVEVSAERGLILINTFFEHEMIHRYLKEEWRIGPNEFH